MRTPPTETDELASSIETGKISALAVDCQRELQACATGHAALFPGGPFDPRLISGVTLANAFGSPWCTAAELSVACRMSLWVFAADWLVDYIAKTREDIDSVTQACLTVADGAAPHPDVPLARLLAEIRDDLAARPAFAHLHEQWRIQLERYLSAMTREWKWKSVLARGDRPAPTFAEYLDNADNFGSSFVNVSHWIFTAEPGTLRHFGALWTVSGQVQKVLRLLNDLATYQRDLDWGDLNPMALGVHQDEMTTQIDVLVKQCRDLLEPLREVAALLDEHVDLDRKSTRLNSS